MPNGNFKKILAASLCYDDDFYKNVTVNKTFSSLNENRVLNRGKPTISRAFRQWNFTVQQYVY